MATNDAFLPKLPQDQLVRLLLDQLHQLGYSDTVKSLEKESHVRLENETWRRFREAFLNAQWDSAEVALVDLGIKYDDDLRRIKFLIRRQKYLELLESTEVEKALSVLRNELMPLGTPQPTSVSQSTSSESGTENKVPDNGNPTSELTKLASCIIFARSGSVGHETMRQHVQWLGSGLASRKHELTKMTPLMPASMSIVPEGRLTTLVHQALTEQHRRCFDKELSDASRDPKEGPVSRPGQQGQLSKAPTAELAHLHQRQVPVRHGGQINLFEDHLCVRNWRSWALEAAAKDAQGELHVLQFSPCGTKIASGGANGIVYIHNIVRNTNFKRPSPPSSSLASSTRSGNSSASPVPLSSEFGLALEGTFTLPSEIPIHISRKGIVSLEWAQVDDESVARPSAALDAERMSVDDDLDLPLHSTDPEALKYPRYWLLVCYQGGVAIIDHSNAKFLCWVSPHTPKSIGSGRRLSAGSSVILEEGGPKNGTVNAAHAQVNPELQSAQQTSSGGLIDHLTAAHWVPSALPIHHTASSLSKPTSISTSSTPKYFVYGGLDGKLRLVSVDKALRYYNQIVLAPHAPHHHNGYTNGFKSQNGHTEHNGADAHFQVPLASTRAASGLSEGPISAHDPARALEEEDRPESTANEPGEDATGQMDVDDDSAPKLHMHPEPTLASSNGFHASSAANSDAVSLSPIIKIWRFPPINDLVITRKGLVITIDQLKHICFTDVNAWLLQHHSKPLSSSQNGRDHRAAEGGVGRGSGFSSRLSTSSAGAPKHMSAATTSQSSQPPSAPIKHQLNLTSCALSPDHQFLLVTTMSVGAPFKGLHHQQSILIYNLNSYTLHETVHGQKQARFVVRASLGGSASALRPSRPTNWLPSDASDSKQARDSSEDGVPGWLLASGSEDSLVHLWEFPASFSSPRPTVQTEPFSKLAPITLPSSHSSVINDVAWNPQNPSMLASVSDDHSLRLWLYKWSQ